MLKIKGFHFPKMQKELTNKISQIILDKFGTII